MTQTIRIISVMPVMGKIIIIRLPNVNPSRVGPNPWDTFLVNGYGVDDNKDNGYGVDDNKDDADDDINTICRLYSPMISISTRTRTRTCGRWRSSLAKRYQDQNEEIPKHCHELL